MRDYRSDDLDRSDLCHGDVLEGGQNLGWTRFIAGFDSFTMDVLTDAEIASATGVFNMGPDGGFEEIDQCHFPPFDEYAEKDRRTITEQHGCRTHRFLRIGAQPDLATKVAKAQQELYEAEQWLQSAQFRLDRARETVAELLAKQATASERPLSG